MSKYLLKGLFICSCFFAWFFDSRLQFSGLLAFFALSFFFYFYLLKSTDGRVNGKWFWAFMLRVPFLFSLPYLSDDFYRFLWDGSLQLQSVNPFESTPIQIQEKLKEFDRFGIFLKLNSPNYFSVYPPVNQVFFFIAAGMGASSFTASVLVLRLIILLGEAVILYLLAKVETHAKRSYLFIAYAFNPLVILEFAGNLHFEVWVIAFGLLSFYCFQYVYKVRWLTGVFFGLAIATKLFPAMFLPLIWHKLGFKKGFYFCVLSGLVVICTFIPYYDQEVFKNLAESIDLFFRNFEFNASIYYVVRWLGFQVVGYNWIATAGIGLKLLSLTLILYISFQKWSFAKRALWIYAVFLFLATTVHPWYLLPLLAISLFSQDKWVLCWTGLVFLSYHAYREVQFEESMVVLILEYGLLTMSIAWFYFLKLKKN